MNMDFIIADGDSLKIYNGTYSYARVHTDKPIGHEKLKRICTALCKKGEPRIIYFHSDNKCGRGDEYACYQDQTLFDYRIKETEKAIIHL